MAADHGPQCLGTRWIAQEWSATTGLPVSPALGLSLVSADTLAGVMRC